MTVETVLSHPIVPRLGWMLVHFVWQGAAVAVLLAVVMLLLRRRSANSRYAAACAALAVMAALPLVTMRMVPVSSGVVMDEPTAAAPASAAPQLQMPSASVPAPVAPPDYEPTELPRSSFAVSPVAPQPSSSWWERASHLFEPALPWVVCGWLVGVLALSLRLLGGWVQAQRLKRRFAQPASDRWREILADLARRLKVSRPVRLLESALAKVPTVVGWFRPVILLPAGVLTGLSPQQVEALIAHELAHIRRYDYLVNLLQTVVETLLFYHPAVWWVSHRIRVEREHCCDDLAVAACGDAVSYARALTELEQLRGERAQLAVTSSGGSLVERVRRLVGASVSHTNRSAWWLAGVIAVAVIIAMGATVHVSSSRSAAASAAEQLGESGAARLQGLIAQLEDEDSGVRSDAAQALGEIDDSQAVEPLIAALEDDNARVRKKAAEALGEIGDGRAMQPLIALLNDRYPTTRMEAVRALGRIGDERAAEPLIPLLTDESWLMRGSATRALAEIRWKPTTREHNVRHLIGAERWDEAAKAGPVARPVPGKSNLVEGALELGVPIVLELKDGENQTPGILNYPWVEFSEAEDRLEAAVHVRYPSWPHTRWVMTVEVLDDRDNVLSHAETIHENTGTIVTYPHREEDRISFDLGPGAGLTDAAKFRFSIESVWTERGNPFEFGKEHPLGLGRIGAQHPPGLALSAVERSNVVTAEWFKVHRLEEGDIGATVHVRFLSWPKREWRVNVELFDADGAVVGRAHTDFENSGVIAGVAAWEERDLHLKMLGPPQAISQAKRFNIRIERLGYTSVQASPRGNAMADQDSGPELASGEAVNGVRLGAEPDGPDQPLGGPVLIRYELGNGSGGPIHYSLPACASSASYFSWFNGFIKVIRPDGLELPFVHYVRSGDAIKIDPRGTETGQIDLGRYFDFLEPGEYRVRLSLNIWPGDAFPTDDQKRFTVASEEFTISLVTPKGATDEKLRPFVVTGTVTDRDARPLPGIEVRTYWYWGGPLATTGDAVTDDDGSYTLHFGPGTGSWDAQAARLRVPVQGVFVQARADGYFERNWCRQGFIGVADSAPGADVVINYSPVILPGQPHRIDFVMDPAARISGRAVDANGQRLANHYIALRFEMERPPWGSQKTWGMTDDEGYFTFRSVPCVPVSLDMRPWHGSDVWCDPIEITRPEAYHVELTVLRDDRGKPRLICKLLKEEDASTRGRDSEPAAGEPKSPPGALPPGTSALRFDGQGDYIEVPHSTSLDVSNAFTLEAWIRFEEGGTENPRIVSKGWEVRNGYEFLTLRTGARRRLQICAKGLARMGSSRELSANAWYHVAATYDGSRMRIYVDGEEVASRSVSGTVVPSETPLNIGRNSGNQTDRYKGAIDEVRIWNVARSAEDIRQNMHRRLTGEEPGLMAYWDFEEGSGQIVRDRSGNGNDGRLGSSESADSDDAVWVDVGSIVTARARAEMPESVTAAPGQDAVPEHAVQIGYADDTAEGKRSIAASGHAVVFERPEGARFVEAVQIFASRYGYPEPPEEDFHLYLLNEEFQVLADMRYPYEMIERGDMRWYTLRTWSIEVPERFYMALAFNAHQTKGIYLGFDESVEQSHSFVGLPESGLEEVEETYDWMVRAYLSDEPSGEKGIQRLADWSPPEYRDPFAGCVELKYDDGESDGMQSYGGAGPGIKFKLDGFLPESVSAKKVKLKGFRLYAGRYGSGYDPDKTMLKVSLLDEEDSELWVGEFPYSLFSYKPKWVDLALAEPAPLADRIRDASTLMVTFNPEATRYKGIYFHYNRDPMTSHSLAGSVARNFKEVPDREWMIRAYLTVE